MPDWLRRFFEDRFVQQWVATVGWAAGVALVLHVIGALGNTNAARAGAWAGAVALGFFAAYATISGVPDVPPAERWQWPAWLAVGSLVLLFLEEAKGGQATLRFGLQLLLVAALLWYLFLPSSAAAGLDDLSVLHSRSLLVGGALAAVLSLVAAEARGAKEPGWRVLIGFTLAAAGATATFAHGSDKAARAMGGLTAALGTSLLVALVQRGQPFGRTAITTASIAFYAALLHAWSVRDGIPWTSAAMLAGAWLASWVPIAPSKPVRSAAVTAVACAALAVGAWYCAQPVAP